MGLPKYDYDGSCQIELFSEPKFPEHKENLHGSNWNIETRFIESESGRLEKVVSLLELDEKKSDAGVKFQKGVKEFIDHYKKTFGKFSDDFDPFIILQFSAGLNPNFDYRCSISDLKHGLYATSDNAVIKYLTGEDRILTGRSLEDPGNSRFEGPGCNVVLDSKRTIKEPPVFYKIESDGNELSYASITVEALPPLISKYLVENGCGGMTLPIKLDKAYFSFDRN